MNIKKFTNTIFRKKLLLIIIYILISIGCNKNEPLKTIPNTSNIIILNDTLNTSWDDYYEYNLNDDVDTLKDISFKLYQLIGSGVGSHFGITLNPLGNTEIIFVQKFDTTFFYIDSYPDTSWSYNTYNQVKDFKVNDTVNDISYLTNEELIITEFYRSFSWQNYIAYQGIERDNLIETGIFYIVLKVNQKYAWMRIHVLNYNSMIVCEYAFFDNQEELIIKNEFDDN